MEKNENETLKDKLLFKSELFFYNEEECKEQKSIQSITTADPRHGMGKWQNHKKHHI